MSLIQLGPTGNLIHGDVLDVNRKHLEEAIQVYDPLLYIQWNPKKCAGWGVWEVRRRPEKKTAIYQGSVGKAHFFTVKDREIDVENHVKDLPHLGYDLLGWIKKHDLWGHINYAHDHKERVSRWIQNFELNEQSAQDQIRKQQRDEAVYQMAQERSAIRDLKTAILSGTNPAHLARHWK